MKTKVLSCFIIFAMLLSTFLLEFPAIAADTADTAAWDGSVAASFSGGSGMMMTRGRFQTVQNWLIWPLL